MSTDRELLEMAAKAAGYPIHSDAWAVGAGGGEPKLYMGSHGPVWNPLTDDGDALRLAVKLGIDVNQRFVGGRRAEALAPAGEIQDEWFEDSDPQAATRRAIVRAAAQIGRSM